MPSGEAILRVRLVSMYISSIGGTKDGFTGNIIMRKEFACWRRTHTCPCREVPNDMPINFEVTSAIKPAYRLYHENEGE